MRENEYQAKLIRKLRTLYPDAIIIKNPTDYIQGLPDLLILMNDRWAMLEVKASLNSRAQPNQQYMVDRLNNMSYASFICPETENGVLNELQHALGIRW